MLVKVSDLVNQIQEMEQPEALKELEGYVEQHRGRILAAADTKYVLGNRWYISNRGSKNNSGLKPEDAWDSIETLMQNSKAIKPGDAVLFERGGLFRGHFICKGGVYYGAYGEGDKPCIYGSAQNYAEAPWKMVSENIWELRMEFEADVGNIIVNHGERLGFKKANREELETDLDFWCDHNDQNCLYVYLSHSPRKFSSIEIGINQNIIYIIEDTEDVIVENLSIKYGGAHGIRCLHGSKNITVRNCELSYLGGSFIPGYKEGITRYGNGIEFWQGCENVVLENNWIYQIYDSGITHQGSGAYSAKNLTVKGNLIENCGMGSIEYWLAYPGKVLQNYAENILYTENILRFAGFGWGGVQRPDKDGQAHIRSGRRNQNHFINYNVTDNIFQESTEYLIEISSIDNTFPKLKGNVYVQNSGGCLGIFAEKELSLDCNSRSKIAEEWGEMDPTVIHC